eukprot:3641710-Prymnesium_polylepis.1
MRLSTLGDDEVMPDQNPAPPRRVSADLGLHESQKCAAGVRSASAASWTGGRPRSRPLGALLRPDP